MLKVSLNALLERLNPFCFDALQQTAALCAEKSHYEVNIEHLLLTFCLEPDADLALILRHYGVDPEALALILNHILAELPRGNPGRPSLSPLLVELLQDAWLTASIELKEESIRSGALLAALLDSTKEVCAGPCTSILRSITREQVLATFDTATTASCESVSPGRAAVRRARHGTTQTAASDSGETAPKSSLERFCTDLSALAASGRMDPVLGREREMRQIIDILARRKKNNPILVGDAGVGKTAVVEGLALRIAAGDVPENLQGVHILSLDVGLLEAGAGMKGEFENRLKTVIREIGEANSPMILFIDEAHVLVGAGGRAGGSDAANLLKPALARGELRTIAATTWPEYKKYFEKDQALTRRFQPVQIHEPDLADTVDILRGLRPRYEKDHTVSIRDDALVAAATLSRRYITGRTLPDKAVDVLDTAAARVRINLSHPPDSLADLGQQRERILRSIQSLEQDLTKGADADLALLDQLRADHAAVETLLHPLQQRWERERDLVGEVAFLRMEPGAPRDLLQQRLEELRALQGDTPLVRHEVDPEVVARVISDWTGIPLGKLLRDHAQTVLDLEISLAARIRGQEQALRIITDAIQAATSGLRDPSQPLGVFLLVGPTGVGKTETALALADLFFGDENSIVALNMSEFQERHSVSRLIGSPPGYVGYGEGGLLTEAIRRRPFCVLLLDEAEKSNPEVLNLFHQVFDKGVLADGEGRPVDFSNTMIFLTSNLAAEDIQEICADGPPSTELVLDAIRPLLSEHFKPSLLGRMTVAPYYPLTLAPLTEIAAIKLERLTSRLRLTNGLVLDFAPEVPGSIAQRCLLNDSGARGIDHILAQEVLPNLSRKILAQMGANAKPGRASLGIDDDGVFTLRVF
jgi:type VI secretion system protein VasG